jgi:hypothetical protein
LFKFSAPLYSVDSSGKSAKAGGLVIGLSGMATYAADSTYTMLFQTELKRTLYNANISFAISLPSVMYIELKATIASSDPQIGKRFVLQLNAMR